jgi:methyl-accepting chemotaxis protein
MLKNLSIRIKLLLLLLLPVLGLLFFAGRELLDKYATLQDLRKTEHLVGLSIRSGALIHELQKERGISSGFINAKGEKFKDDLSKQRKLSDDQFMQLANYIAANKDAEELVKPALEAAAKQKEKLQEMRSRIDSLRIEGKDSFAFYSGINYSYLDLVAAVARSSREPELMRAGIAYFAFSKVKEEMGKERATLNAVISGNTFNPETYQRTFAILSAQKSFLEGFRKFGSITAVATYDEREKSEPFKKVEELRSLVVSKGMEGNFGLAPEVWFSAITAKIDLMKEIEDGLAKEILKQAEGLADKARLALIVSSAVSVIMGSLTLFLGLLIARSITGPLKRLVEMLQDIAEGEGDLTRSRKAARMSLARLPTGLTALSTISTPSFPRHQRRRCRWPPPPTSCTALPSRLPPLQKRWPASRPRLPRPAKRCQPPLTISPATVPWHQMSPTAPARWPMAGQRWYRKPFQACRT